MKKNLFEISSEEKERILLLHENSTKNMYLNLISEGVKFEKGQTIQKALRKLGFKSVGGADGKYGQKTACAVYEFQKKNNLRLSTPKGKVDILTAKKLSELTGLNIVPFAPNNVDVSICDKQNKKDNKQQQSIGCESLLPDTCSQISSRSQEEIGNGGGEGCSEYVRKSLGETLGNAWQAFNVGKKYGVKYNMFTDGSINWTDVRNKMKSNGINSNTCGCFTKEGEGKDKSCKDGSNIATTISSFYPSSSNVSLQNLKVGDYVGMYYKNSGNKGKAFCERAQQRGLDGSGNVKDNDPFTFNTHVGYVGAIKDGMPIIYHSVHGTRLATPANKLLSKSGDAMIAWVTGSAKSAKPTEQKGNDTEKSWSDKMWDWFKK